MNWFGGVIIASLLLFGAVRSQYTIELAEALRTELLANYSKQQRPAVTVFISLSLTILTINDLNIKDQSLSLSGYLTVEWSDTRLEWYDTSKTSRDFTAINFMYASEQYIWRPSILIENSVDDISVISGKDLPMRVTQRGLIIWNPAGIYVVSCESDTRFYPMDTQTCYIKASSWAYTSADIRLIFRSDPVDLAFYSENGEWDLLSASGSREETVAIGSNSFSSVIFEVKLQRRLMFHVINTLFPVALMAILIAVVFKLSVESGEKIGFSLTVLLSYAVYLTLISENIPSTSTTICYLSMYLAFILLLATIAVCCTTLVINLHMMDEDVKMSPRLQKITRKYLMKLAGCTQACSCSKGKVDSFGDEPSKDKFGDDVNSKITVLKDKPEDITWKELSKIMDKVFYRIYILLICLSTLALFLVILIGYIVSG